MTKTLREDGGLSEEVVKPPTPNPKEKKKQRKDEDKEREEFETETNEKTEIGDPTAELTGKNLLGAMEVAAATPKKSAYIYEQDKVTFQRTTKHFEAIAPLISKKVKPFGSTEVFGEGNTIHDKVREAKARIIANRKKTSDYEPTKDDWASYFIIATKHRTKSEYADKWELGLKLCKTPPDIFGLLFADGRLVENTQTTAWTVANETFGAKWKLQKSQPKITFTPETFSQGKKNNPYAKDRKQQKQKTPLTTKKNKNTAVKTTNGLFMRQEMPTAKPTKLFETKKKYTTYLKARFPKVREEGIEGDKEFVHSFNKLVNYIYKLDPSAVLVPWLENSKAPMVACETDEAFKSKSKIMNYVNSAFIKQNNNIYTRIKIGHQKSREIFTGDAMESLHMSEDILSELDPIQAQQISCIGWLLGAHPRGFDTKAYVLALKAHSLVRGLDVEIRIHMFKLEPKKRPDEDVKVVHIYCAKQTAGKLKGILNSIYGSKRKSDSFPLGRNYRFIPYTADVYQPVTPQLKRLATEALMQQKQFISSMEIIETDRISGLDYYIKPPVDTTLREVLMAMKASDGTTNLFDSVDTTWMGNVGFLVHNDLATEAHAVISFLPLILEAKFGSRTWGWFKDFVKSEMTGMYWDEAAGRVKSSAEEELAADLADWKGLEELEDSDEDEEDQAFTLRMNLDIQIDMDASREQYQLFDENGSLATFGNFITQDSSDEREDEEMETDGGHNSGTVEHPVTIDGNTDPTSTITQDSIEALAQRFQEDPTFREMVLNKTNTTTPRETAHPDQNQSPKT